MFMQSPIEGLSRRTGTQLAHFTFDRCLHDRETFPYKSGFAVELDNTSNTSNTPPLAILITIATDVLYLLLTCRIIIIFKVENYYLDAEALNCTSKTAFLNTFVDDSKVFVYRRTRVLKVPNDFVCKLASVKRRQTINCNPTVNRKVDSVANITRKTFRSNYEQNSILKSLHACNAVGLQDNTNKFCDFKETVFEELKVLFLITLYAVLSHAVKQKRGNCFNQNCDIYFFVVLVVVSTVRTLYAGTLVTCWTTAPSHESRRSSSALLAAFCLVLATLTIAARCYASKNGTHQLAQLSSNPQTFSSIDKEDSKFHTHSSKIVLNRLLRSVRQDIERDTRIILTDSKKLLYNQNFKITNITNLNAFFRKKREFKSDKNNFFNNFRSYDGKFIVNQNNALYSVDSQSKQSDGEPSAVNDNKSSTFVTRHTPNQTSNHKVTEIFPSRSLETNGHSVNTLTDPSVQTQKHSNVQVHSANASESAWNAGVNVSRVSDTLQVVNQQNDQSSEPVEDRQPTTGPDIKRPMPPAHDNGNNSLSESGVLAVVYAVVVTVVLTVALGLATCVLSHYRGGTAADPHDAGQTPTTAPMLSVVSAGAAAGVGGMDRLRGRGAARELAATRDRQVRLHAVHTDIAINLPPNIAMPDGEEHPFASSRLHIRDTEQESEIYQKCIRPPPNRTVLESESPPPYRSSSAGLLGSMGSSSSGSSDWSAGSSPLVVRCHSMSSTSKRPEAGPSGQKTDFIQRTVKIFTGKKSQPPPAPTLPVVIVPTRPRHIPEQQQNSSGRPKPSV